jgi:hypothetical protein
VAIVVAVLILAGLGWAAWKRWGHGRSPTPDVHGPATQVVPPADLPGLGYLPESTEAILAIQVPPLVERLGPEAGGDPAQVLRHLGIPDAVRETIEKVSGVGLRNADQMVVGLGFEKGRSLPPQIVVVVHTREPYDLAGLVHRTKARTLKKAGRTLHVASASPIPEVYWWGPNDRILIGAISARDYDGVPMTPRAGIDHLRPNLARLVRERVSADACAWLVASSDKWEEYLVPYVVLPGSPLAGRRDLLPAASLLRGVSLSVPFNPDRPAELCIERKSASGGEELRAALAERFAGTRTEVSGEGETCILRTPLDPGAVDSLINKLVAPTAK